MARRVWRRGGYWIAGFSLPADESAARLLRIELRQSANAVRFPVHQLDLLLVGATEAISNAVKHGNYRSGNVITVSIQSKSDEMIVRLCYAGEPFLFESTDRSLPYSLRDVGHGHHLMHASLDEVHYYFRRGLTLARLIKRA
jgi:anti-sigma regulatory factor (Ser/Thr protein kinase)